jgi:type VI secretion system protein ImpE
LAQEIIAAEAKVREAPAAATHRWALFQLLCVAQQWTRAIQQLQAFAQLDASQGDAAQLYRELVRAEHVRANVMAGMQEPDFIFEGNPAWMQAMHAALNLTARGHSEEADATRETALDEAPLVVGNSPLGSFDWIGDSDSRLGPICEFIVAGRYRWMSFADLSSWHIERPVSLVDLIWAPGTLTLADGTQLKGFMPARYPAQSTGAPSLGASERDALLLCRRTVWHDVGRTGVIASGCKTWATSAGDYGVFDLADCTFGMDSVAHRLNGEGLVNGAAQ